MSSLEHTTTLVVVDGPGALSAAGKLQREDCPGHVLTGVLRGHKRHPPVAGWCHWWLHGYPLAVELTDVGASRPQGVVARGIVRYKE